MLYNYTFANRKRDLSDVMATVIKDEPRFISNFRTAPDAVSAKHEYLEDQLTGRGITAQAITNGKLTLSAADAAKLKTGTLVALKDDPALFRVKTVSGTQAEVELAANNGSALSAVTSLPADGGVFIIVSTPMNEGTSNGDGEENYHLANVQWNATQIFRKEIVLSGTALAVNLYGNADNQLNRQTAFALADLARDLNRVALFGRRVEAGVNTRGEAGGLYFFGTQSGVPVIDAAKSRLDSFLINDAAQNILGEGGDPMQILCSPGQARVISNEYRDRIQILRSDDRRGAYVAVIVNEINGRGMTIMADPDMPDNDAWVLDTGCFALASLSGRAITDMDATPGGFDGIRRVAIGELTFEFKNVAQRCCRIKNLLGSSEAIAALRTA
ncbi:MAG: hypothetical protein E7057_05375 [Lentisphaerae bacterium]|nr:hypothetical protein [Lentisphaerota bacterium]